MNTSSQAQDFYAIRVKDHLDPRWSEWFEGLTVTRAEGGETILSGPVADQAALHGLLAKVRDLNLTLISVNRVDPCKTMEAKHEGAK
jgi:hypothetical protein